MDRDFRFVAMEFALLAPKGRPVMNRRTASVKSARKEAALSWNLATCAVPTISAPVASAVPGNAPMVKTAALVMKMQTASAVSVSWSFNNALMA